MDIVRMNHDIVRMNHDNFHRDVGMSQSVLTFSCWRVIFIPNDSIPPACSSAASAVFEQDTWKVLLCPRRRFMFRGLIFNEDTRHVREDEIFWRGASRRTRWIGCRYGWIISLTRAAAVKYRVRLRSRGSESGVTKETRRREEVIRCCRSLGNGLRLPWDVDVIKLVTSPSKCDRGKACRRRMMHGSCCIG